MPKKMRWADIICQNCNIYRYFAFYYILCIPSYCIFYSQLYITFILYHARSISECYLVYSVAGMQQDNARNREAQALENVEGSGHQTNSFLISMLIYNFHHVFYAAVGLGLCAVCAPTGALPILRFDAFFRGPQPLPSCANYIDIT